MVSADSQGNGEIAAQTLANRIPKNGTMGIIGFGVDFFVTNERVTGLKRWLKANRPDIKLKQANFNDPDEADRIAQNFLTANPDIKGLFVVWDAPAMGAASSVRTVGKNIPITTIDLGLQVAVDMATKGGLIAGLGAQRPYDQGVAEARAAMRAIVGKNSPPWVGVQSLAVVPSNVLEAYKTVWHTAPPKELVDACKANPACKS
jgi:ribose transport system substrate-binding protein